MGYTWDIPGWRNCLWDIRVVFQIKQIYPMYIPNPTFSLRKNRGQGSWCQSSGAGAVAPAPPTIASDHSVSSSISLTPSRAARHAGDLPMCLLTALSVGYYVKNIPRSSQHAQTYWFVESSPARASRLISRQALLNESNRAACHTVPLCQCVLWWVPAA